MISEGEVSSDLRTIEEGWLARGREGAVQSQWETFGRYTGDITNYIRIAGDHNHFLTVCRLSRSHDYP